MKLNSIFLMLAFVFAFSSCQENNDAVNSFKVGLQAPLIKPPVQAATPAGLLTTSSGTSSISTKQKSTSVGPRDEIDTQTPMEIIQSRFFNCGPPDIL